MPKHQKSLERICGSPTPSDVRWDELKGALGFLGYTMLKNKGSRRKFYNSKTGDLINCHEPHPSSIVARWCIEQVVEHLKERGVVKD